MPVSGQADQGNLPAAARTLREVIRKFFLVDNDADLIGTREDLEAEALESDRYSASDRKYHVAQSRAAYDMKSEYGRTIRRKR